MLSICKTSFGKRYLTVQCQKITNYYEACEIKIAEMESEYDVAFKCMVDGCKRSDKDETAV